MSYLKRGLALLLTIVLVFTVAGGAVLATEEEVTGTDATGADLSADVGTDAVLRYKYSEYSEAHADARLATGSFTVAANSYVKEKSSADIKVDTQYEQQDAETFAALNGIKGASVYTGEQTLSDDGTSYNESYITWEIDVPETALYAINVLYYTMEGKNSDIERALSIDGEKPFTEASGLIFPRTWKDAGEATEDVHGNQLRPKSEEVYGWYDIDCRDASGNYGRQLYFYLEKGTHEIRLDSQREAMIVNRLTFYAPQDLKTYAELQAEYKEKGYKMGTDASVDEDSVVVKVQAEQPALKSSTTLYAEYDRTTPVMEPYAYDRIVLNEIDGGKFTSPYQWMTWNVDVKEAGLYRIITRFQQSSKDGSFCNRTLYINGEIPCEEAQYIRFDYDNGWQVQDITDDVGNTMYFFLDAGINTITLEVTLGEFADVLDRVDSTIYTLNQCYREILMITGSTPDTFRDYNFKGIIPDTLAQLASSSKELKDIVTDIEQLVGDTGSFTSSFKTLIEDLDTMTENPRVIAKRLTNFKSNLGTISTWLLNATSQPVSMDWVMVAPQEAGDEIPDADAGFFKMLKHHFMMFLASFYVDYNDIGRREETTDASQEITVWITTSLDQSQIVRSLINDELSKTNPDLKVNLQLVSAATVLPSIAAGTGPDIVLGVASTDPLNYAIRGAVVDMSQFDSYEEVMSRFNANAVRPYQYKGKTYGVPETFSFPMLFYRQDIMDELGLDIPQTWDEVYDCIVKLNMNSMMFGIPGTSTTAPSISTYGTLLYQNGGSFYNSDGTASALDQPEAIQIFQRWTEYFTAYDCLVTYDFANRFRTGETPIGIADYTQYNQLSVFAPEIKGLWSFTSVPGTPVYDDNGNAVIKDGEQVLDRTTLGGGTASVILSSSENPEAAWEFLDWWTSTEIQVAYGLEIESILGTASRYATANLAAAERLPWSTTDFNAIRNAWNDATTLPEYPGSYILTRYINFAFLEVVNNTADPGEELLDYVKMINEELTRKQAEFAEIDE